MNWREYQFDGLVGLTHNYAGLSFGNTASIRHEGRSSNPKEAILQGLEKMRFVSQLGVGQAVLPPHDRPQLRVLRDLGFKGSDEVVLARVAKEEPHLLRLVSSASSMWTANAATVSPSCDTTDGRLHLVPANLAAMAHRAFEASTTYRVLKSIFRDEHFFDVFRPLPSGVHFADEGAANHTRLKTSKSFLHLFAWGRSVYQNFSQPKNFPGRQTFEASRSLARLHSINPTHVLFPQQDPAGIDAGAFHTDVMAVGNDDFLMFHEHAFVDTAGFKRQIRSLLGDELEIIEASESELSSADAVRAYPFNSQVLTLPNSDMCIVAPVDSEENVSAKRFLDRVVSESKKVKSVHYMNIRQSMQNGGGPACLRLRVLLNEAEQKAIKANIFWSEELDSQLRNWADKFYPDSVKAEDLADPALWKTSMMALDELTSLLQLGSIYDFQS